MYSDLSPYEVARLKNIQKNKLKLTELGIETSKPSASQVSRPSNKDYTGTTAPRKKRKARKKCQARKAPRIGTRRSSRLAGLKAAEDEMLHELKISIEPKLTSCDDLQQLVNYDLLPLAPEELDDHEFEIYAAIRKWRLDKKNELAVEPYKICQNRTICELIRRRRVEKSWATDLKKRSKDLLQVWGICTSLTFPYLSNQFKVMY